MKFATRLRELRLAKSFSQRKLAAKVGVNFTYLSKIENEKLDFADYPSEEMICKLSRALDADEDELLLLAEKIPYAIKRRVLERPEVFRAIASLDDNSLNRLMRQVAGGRSGRQKKPR